MQPTVAAITASRQETELRTIIDGALDYAIITTDLDRLIVSWSIGTEQILGWTAGEAVGHKIDMIFTPEDQAAGVPSREAERAAKSGRGDDERWHQRKDGRRVFMNGSVHPLLAEDGKTIRGFIKIARDETKRRQTEERLRESEEFNRRILAASADCIKVLDLDGNLEFMTEGGMCVMEVEDFGVIKGACWPDFWPGEGHALAEAAVARARTGETARFHGFATTLKGSPRWWDVIVSPIDGPDGRPERLLSVSRDVTSTQKAEERLRESEERLRLATDAAEIGFWDVDVVNDQLIWPPRVKAMFGIGADREVSMRDFYEGLHPDDRDTTTAAFQAATDPEKRALYDVQYRTVGQEDGIVRWLAAEGRGLFDHDGRCVRVVGVVRDITQRKRIDARLQELNETLEAQVAARTGERNQLWELSLDLMLRCGFSGEILTVNPAWTEMLGWREDELIGTSLFDLVHPDDLAHTRDGAAAHAGGASYTRFENRYRHKDGSYRSIAWTTRPGDGVITAVGRNVTAEKEAAAALAETEEALRQSQKMEAVGQLTGGLAHDFNNLLAGISGALELMSLRIEQGRVRDVERYMAAAQGATKRAAALTHRLLAFSRRQTLMPKAISVSRLVVDMLELVQRTVGPAISVENVAGASLWATLVDPSQLENALLNLCINARDAMPDGGRLTIETCNRWIDRQTGRQLSMPEGQYVSLCVSDTGVGMPPEVIEKAFDPFFTTKPIGQGTGLGLSMIYGFAKQSGGQVRIYSEVGQGTMVCLYLPRHAGEAEDETAVPPQEISAQAEAGETVLIVDDEPTVRLLVTEILEELGYTAIEASDSVAGLRVLQSDVRIDLLISDVGLPGGMNGRQMADAGRVNRPDLKVLFITGFAENALLNAGQLAPGMAVLTKPFAIDVLAARVRELVGSAR